MDALILSCGTGGGHNSAGAAIEKELSARGHNVKTLNPYSLKGNRTANAINNAYNVLVQKFPPAFGAIYRLGDAYRRLPFPSPLYYWNRRMVPYLERYMEAHHFDAVVMTHLFPAEILTNMKRRGTPAFKSYFIATDYACTPFTEETDCDCYIIPAEDLKSDFMRRGIPEGDLYPLGIPVQKPFRQNGGRAEARARLRLDPGKKHIFVAGGSIGAGQIETVVSLLLSHYDRDQVGLTVVCGNNRALYVKLAGAYGKMCTVLEQTENMADYMRACDLFISKPGGLSSTEAAAVGTALIHITPISGCEIANMRFFAQRGMSLPVTAPKKQLLAACDKLMGEAPRAQMCARQHETIQKDAAAAICDLIESRYTQA